MLSSQKMMSEQSAGGANYIDDVFSTYLYTGNGSSQVIENGIALGNANSGGSAFFDGSSYLTVAGSSQFEFGTGDFTIEYWVYPTALACVPVGQTYNASGYAIQPYINSGTGSIELAIGATSNTTSNGAVVLNQWNHVAIVRSGTTLQVLTNGTSKGSWTYSSNAGDNATMGIGARPSGNYKVNGNVSNVRIVKGTALYSGSTYTVPTSALTAISGTSLLVCQGDAPFTDNSTNAFTITRNGDVAAKSFGPFTAAEAGKGGLVWIKARDSISASLHHNLWDTVRGNTKRIFTSLTNGESTDSPAKLNFNSDGFSLASDYTNTTDSKYASWTFRKQAKFFDVVTYTGNGVDDRQIAHSLGSEPGCVIIKRTDTAGDWVMSHNYDFGNVLFLNKTDAGTNNPSTNSYFGYPDPPLQTTYFTVGTNAATNANGGTYVAYLFAHNAGGFGTAGTDNVISCGSCDSAATVNLGYEPQWLLIKASSTTGNWTLIDNMRGWTQDNYAQLRANTTAAEATAGNDFVLTSTGFKCNLTTGTTFVYIAIRRPMKPPTTGTEVFKPVARAGTGTNNLKVEVGFAPDWVLPEYRNTDATRDSYDRLRGPCNNLQISATDAETGSFNYPNYGVLKFENTSYTQGNADSAVYNSSSYNFVDWVFRRAPGFFDVVCYTGNGTARSINHNLEAIPELVIIKERPAVEGAGWRIYQKFRTGTNKVLGFDNNLGEFNDTNAFPNSSNFSTTTFSVGTGASVNSSASYYVAYLFATLAGISKVGSYTGTGTTKQIDCGFTGGARFVMIKRTDSTGDWYVWDSARGIVSGNDPYLLLNSTAAETTSTDYIDPYSAGFEISSTAPAAINANGGSYIYLAIA